MSRHPHRCGRCRKRYTFRKPLQGYSSYWLGRLVGRRDGRCGECGGNVHPDPAVHRSTRENRCNCGGIAFPHKLGSRAAPQRGTSSNWGETFYCQFFDHAKRFAEEAADAAEEAACE